jgi:hypothetical protein
MTYSWGIAARDGGGNGLGTKESIGSAGELEGGVGKAMTDSKKPGWALCVFKKRNEKMGRVGRGGLQERKTIAN